MGNRSKYFSTKELECHGKKCCGHSSPVSQRLLDVLDEIRDTVGAPVKLSCAFRCLVHNRSEGVGSRDTSQHPLGTAADIQTPWGMSADEVYDIALDVLEMLTVKGGAIFKYEWGCHIDVRFGDEIIEGDMRDEHDGTKVPEND